MAIDNDNILFFKKYVKMAIRRYAKFSYEFIRQKETIIIFFASRSFFFFLCSSAEKRREGKRDRHEKC